MEENACAHVVRELDGDEDAGEEEAVDAEGVEGDGGVAAGEAIEVDVGNDVAGGTATGVTEYALEVGAHRDGWFADSVEGRRRRHRAAAVRLVALRQPVEDGGESGDGARDCGGFVGDRLRCHRVGVSSLSLSLSLPRRRGGWRGNMNKISLMFS